MLFYNEPVGAAGATDLVIDTGYDRNVSWAVVAYAYPHSSWRPPWTDGAPGAQLTSGPAGQLIDH